MIRLAAFLAILGSPAYAACALRDVVTDRLADRYGETLRAGWLGTYQGQPYLFELWASSETGTSTITRTSPARMTCVIAAGTDFYAVDVVDGDPL